MGLKRNKGFNIVTKSTKCKLSREGFSFAETKKFFNEVVEFYFMAINTSPEGFLDSEQRLREKSGKPKTTNMHYEALTIWENCHYPLPFSDVPSTFRRAAIKKAIGAYSSWYTNHQRWLSRPKRHKHHKPPVQPSKFNFSPQFYSGMFKDLLGNEITLKIRVNSQWKWVKHSFKGRNLGNEWIMSSPSVVIQNATAYISFPVEKYIPATGGIANQVDKETVRILGVDIDLDRHAAILSVLELKDNQVREIARRFIKSPNGINLRKRDLGKIAIKMNQTGIIHKGFCFKKWEKIRNREKDMGYQVAREIIEYAHGYGCQIISFEHLKNLRSKKGKYSKRSNQKRSYWLKDKIYQNVKVGAYNDYSILTTRVNPRNTSRLDPWGNNLTRKNYIPQVVEEKNLEYNPGASWVKSHKGYTAHSGINAARNIGFKAVLRYKQDAQFYRDKDYTIKTTKPKTFFFN